MLTIKTLRTLFISIFLVFGMQAYAQSLPMTKTFEVSATSLRMPATANGTIALRECEDCDYHSLRVTSQTSYQINGRGHTLSDFKKLLVAMKSEGDVYVNVKRDDTTNTVASVFIYSE